MKNNVSEKEVIIAGIFENGFIFAKKIKKLLKKYHLLKVVMCKVMIDKKNPIQCLLPPL